MLLYDYFRLDLSHLKLYDGKPMNVFPSDTSESEYY